MNTEYSSYHMKYDSIQGRHLASIKKQIHSKNRPCLLHAVTTNPKAGNMDLAEFGRKESTSAEIE